jgi:alanine or glycine:cation symporter, AGCS family
MLSLLASYADALLMGPFILIIGISTLLTILSRGVQFRSFSVIAKIIKQATHGYSVSNSKLPPFSALAMAMSTTIGIGNMVGPIIAIGYGGPGTLLGFILGTLLGSATTFTEVILSIMYRKLRGDGTIAGGPMEYLREELGPKWAWYYAFFGFLLLVAWSSSQSNTLAILLNQNGVNPAISGVILAILVLYILMKGVSWIGKLSEILVPIMFLTYSSITLWIIIQNAEKLPGVWTLICSSFFSPKTLIGGASGLGFSQVIRWGFARAIQANEIGTGTSTFPHSITTGQPKTQAALATLAIYTNGFLCVLSGLTVLVTDFWKQPGAVFDITLFSKILTHYYGTWGHIILTACACMFAFGTILGNCYNGSQCFLYVTENRWLRVYYYVTALAVFLGAIAKVSVVWSIIDYFIIPVAVPHIIALLIIALRRPSIFELTTKTSHNTKRN